MTFFDGLFTYEIILLVLGVVLFCVLLVVLIYQVKNSKRLGGLVPLFLVVVVMIAYPSIQKIKVGSDTIEVEKLTKDLKAAQGAQTESVSMTLRSRLAEIEQRPIRDADTQLAIARAQAAIGERNKALTSITKVLRVKPGSAEAHTLQKELLKK